MTRRHHSAPFALVRPLVLFGALFSAGFGGLMGSLAQAQTPIYRSVGADGRVSFSDRPASGATVAGQQRADTPSQASALPYALQQLRQRYPVTLYSGPACSPCAQGRQLLQQRGIPYDEKTVSSAEDLEALMAIQADRTLPLLSIGTHKVSGFAAAEWQQYLDAAGYPSSSTLPARYRAPEPSPLAPPHGRGASPSPGDAAVAPARAPLTQALPAGSNPAGIRF